MPVVLYTHIPVCNIYKTPYWEAGNCYPVCPMGQEENNVRLNGIQRKAKLLLCIWLWHCPQARQQRGHKQTEHSFAHRDCSGLEIVPACVLQRAQFLRTGELLINRGYFLGCLTDTPALKGQKQPGQASLGSRRWDGSTHGGERWRSHPTAALCPPGTSRSAHSAVASNCFSPCSGRAAGHPSGCAVRSPA